MSRRTRSDPKNSFGDKVHVMTLAKDLAIAGYRGEQPVLATPFSDSREMRYRLASGDLA